MHRLSYIYSAGEVEIQMHMIGLVLQVLHMLLQLLFHKTADL